MENYSLKINLDLLDQNRAFQGKKGRYLELVMIATPNGQYGTHMVKQSLSKEERQSGKQMPILGNASPLGQRQPAQSTAPKTHSQPDPEDQPPF